MTYYGQFETDKIIEQYFLNKSNGICVEVGAYDGIINSNTKLFEDKGWTTICIEPNPNIFQKLISNRKGTCIEIACSNKIGQYNLTIFHLPEGKESALTGLEPDERLIQSHSSLIQYISHKEVKTDTLSNILTSINLDNNIDFISIDTENTELDVLEGLNLNKWRPFLLVVENNFNDSHISKYLNKYNYMLDQRYVVNDFYIRRDL